MYILALVLAVIVILVIIIYNTILSKKNKLIKAYSSLDVMLKKRYDLIPNIVECVKGYKNYESQTLEKIISLRKEADKCNSTSDMEKLQALSEFRELSNNEGKVLVCDDGTITIPQIRDYVMKHYDDILFENDVLISENFIEWTRFLRNIGYIKYVTFNKKGKEHKESKPTPQPTDLFKDTFVKQGMAMVRSTNDERNKEIITYTKDIEKFIVSDYFKENFFKYFNVA